MKHFFKHLLIIVLALGAVTASGQTKLNQIERSESMLTLPISSKQIVLGSDTSYQLEYASLEIRNDSLCIIDDACFFRIDGLGIEAYSISYNNNSKGFDIFSTSDGQSLVQFIPFDVRRNTATINNNDLIIFTQDQAYVTEPASFQTSMVRTKNHLDVSEINDSTLRVYIGKFDGFGFQYERHDSIDVVIPQTASNYSIEYNDSNSSIELYSDGVLINSEILPLITAMTVSETNQNTRLLQLDRPTGFPTIAAFLDVQDGDADPTNELQDTSQIPGLQEFVENYSINEGDGFESNTDNQQLSVTSNQVTLENGGSINLTDLNYWDKNGTELSHDALAQVEDLKVNTLSSSLVWAGGAGKLLNVTIGNNITFSGGTLDADINDADADPTNEIQTPSEIVGLQSFIEQYSINDPNDADADPTNELQDTSQIPGLQEFVENYSINEGDGYEANTDNQQLSISGTQLTLEDGGTVTIPQDGYEPNTDTQLTELEITNMGFLQNELWNKSANGIHDITGTASIFDSKESTILNDNGSGGTRNIWIGRRAGQNNITGGNNNVGIANDALFRLTTGDGNVAIGNQAGNFNTSGNNNFFLGAQSASNHTTANNCVYIGNVAGNLNNTSNRLFISGVGYHVNPLIYGEFDNRKLQVMSELSIKRYSANNAVLTFDGLSDWEIRNDDTNLKITRLSGTGDLYVGSKLRLEDTNAGNAVSILGLDASNRPTLNGVSSLLGSSPWVSGSQGQIYRLTSGSVGNVGINKTSPPFPLSVEGSVWIDGGTIIDDDNQGGFDHQFVSEDPANDRLDWRYVQPSFSVNSSTGVVTATILSSATNNTGSFTIPSAPVSIGRATMGSISVSSTSWTLFNVSGVDFDEGSITVSDNLERFTVSESGYYRVSYNGEVDWATGNELEVRVKKSGAGQIEYKQYVTLNNEDTEGFTFTDIIYLNANQYIQLEARRVFQGGGTCNVFAYLSLQKL